MSMGKFRANIFAHINYFKQYLDLRTRVPKVDDFRLYLQASNEYWQYFFANIYFSSNFTIQGPFLENSFSKKISIGVHLQYSQVSKQCALKHINPRAHCTSIVYHCSHCHKDSTYSRVRNKRTPLNKHSPWNIWQKK